MAEKNTSNVITANNVIPYLQQQVMTMQASIGIFLFVNSFLICNFFRKEAFYTNARYILFVHTLLCDCMFLMGSDLLLLLILFEIYLPVGLCIVLCTGSTALSVATPLTLTAMSLERYVAICMPLRHTELSTPHRALCCLLIIHVLSFIQSLILLFNFVATAPLSIYTSSRLCNGDILTVQKWQIHVKSAVTQIYFLIMASTIVFTYIKIMNAAKVASGDKKNVTSKGLKTVLLHGFQLLLCLVQLWTPFIEAAVFQISFDLFANIRYVNYIAFFLAPRCLIPLIYGLRDEQFYHALKYYACCVPNNKISIIVHK